MATPDKIFIHATAARHFVSPDGSQTYDVKRDDVGAAPGWLTECPYFQLCTSGKNPEITYIGAPPVYAAKPAGDGQTDTTTEAEGESETSPEDAPKRRGRKPAGDGQV